MADKYDIQARYIPAIVCSVPFVALGFYFLGSIDLNFWGKVFAIGFGGLTMMAALYQVFAHFCRLLGKWLEENMFNDGLDFPTTILLLDDDPTCTPERKSELYRKIKAEFNIELEGKTADTPANRRRIHEAVGQIRKRFFKKNEMVLQRNIQFGVAKNLAGGAIIAILTSVVAIILSWLTNSDTALKVSTFLLITYALLAVGALWAMKFTAKHYALTLFDEFIGG